MDLKELLGDSLADQVQAAIDRHNSEKGTKVKLVDLAEGGYVSKDKFNDKTNTLQTLVDDLNNQLAARDSDLATLQGQLKDAGPEKLGELQKSLNDLQGKYDQAAKDWQAKLDSQAYEFLVKEKAGELSFSSAAAKKQFVREAVEKGFKMDGDNLLGYNDWLSEYKKTDPGSFVESTGQESKKPTITKPAAPDPKAGVKLSLGEMMARKNADPNYTPTF